MITIYNFTHGVRGIRVAWQCEEMGLDYQTVAFGFPAPAYFRNRYPLGVLPFLEDDDGVAVGESVAQMLYLVERYDPAGLLPEAPHDMARVLQLTIASEASLGGLMNPMMGAKFAAPADQKSNWSDTFCEMRVKSVLDYLETGLGGNDYFVGNALSLADIAISTALGIWQGALGKAVPAALADHRRRMQSRPGYKNAVAAFQNIQG